MDLVEYLKGIQGLAHRLLDGAEVDTQIDATLRATDNRLGHGARPLGKSVCISIVFGAGRWLFPVAIGYCSIPGGRCSASLRVVELIHGDARCPGSGFGLSWCCPDWLFGSRRALAP